MEYSSLKCVFCGHLGRLSVLLDILELWREKWDFRITKNVLNISRIRMTKMHIIIFEILQSMCIVSMHIPFWTHAYTHYNHVSIIMNIVTHIFYICIFCEIYKMKINITFIHIRELFRKELTGKVYFGHSLSIF